MLDYILHIDRELFLLLNGAHCPWLDPVMKFITGIPQWIPLYVLIVFFFFWKRPWKAGLLALAGILITFALTDQLGVHLFKNTVQRLRPCHDPIIGQAVHLLEGCGGKFGFLSNHAANTFGLASFTALFFRKPCYTVGIYTWAALVGYSRIYVGKHFPLDVLCGALFGMLVGYLLYRLYRCLAPKKQAGEGRKPFSPAGHSDF
jgi:undecaprenyl-diphosphatase